MNHHIDMHDATTVDDAVQRIEWVMVLATAILCAGITALALPWPI